MRHKAQEILCNHFGPFGPIFFPFVQMGNIDSLHLFGFTELIIFAFYLENKQRYGNVLDIGANLGLHSILMDKLGWTVRAYEPDAEHYTKLLSNLKENKNKNVITHMAAVHTKDGEANFVRVFNNLTGNHLEGYKDTTERQMTHLDIIVEVRNEKNASLIYNHFMNLDVPMWSQKINWDQVKTLDDMPKVNRDGSLFIGHQPPFA